MHLRTTAQEFETTFEAMYPELAEAFGTLHHPNFLGALAEIEDRALVLETFMQGDAIHPNAEGVALIVEDIGPKVQELADRVR